MAAMLPKLFFVHFSSTSFTAVDDGQTVGFLIGFVSQTFPDQAYIHLGYDGEGEDRVIFTKDLDALDTVR